jgi:hypothetical protein
MFGITRKRLAVSSALTIAAVLVLALATPTSAGSPVIHRVHVGGPGVCAAYVRNGVYALDVQPWGGRRVSSGLFMVCEGCRVNCK